MTRKLVSAMLAASLIAVPAAPVGAATARHAFGGCFLNPYRPTRYRLRAVGDASLNCGWDDPIGTPVFASYTRPALSAADPSMCQDISVYRGPVVFGPWEVADARMFCGHEVHCESMWVELRERYNDGSWHRQAAGPVVQGCHVGTWWWMHAGTRAQCRWFGQHRLWQAVVHSDWTVELFGNGSKTDVCWGPKRYGCRR